jgi:hypothetical protein
MVMSGPPKHVRLLFGFEATDWLFLFGGVALVAGFTAAFVL